MTCDRSRRRAVRAASLLLAALLLTAMPGVALPGAGAAQAADGYVADIADLPLMPGLDEVPEAGVAFDKPAGRIVSAYAHGAVTAAAVRRFYRETLPQLGWTPATATRYTREDELLRLELLGRDGDLTVRYTLQPR
jgi:hypothetical protein